MCIAQCDVNEDWRIDMNRVKNTVMVILLGSAILIGASEYINFIVSI